METKLHQANTTCREVMLENLILRSLCVKNETTYLKLYESNVIPIVMYASQIWRPSKIYDVKLLQCKEDLSGKSNFDVTLKEAL